METVGRVKANEMLVKTIIIVLFFMGLLVLLLCPPNVEGVNTDCVTIEYGYGLIK